MTWDESSVLNALEAYHPSSQWVFLRHVPNGTASYKTRTADALAMGCWRSSGIELHGYEVKVSRSDWLREIQDVQKARALAKHCHYWWVVAPQGVVKEEEMPANWGLKVIGIRGDKPSIRIRKAVTRNDAATIDYTFFAAMLRKAKDDNLNDAELRRKLQKCRDEAYESGRETERTIAKGMENGHERQLRELKEKVAKFEKLSGLKLDGWHGPENAAKAMAEYLKHGDPLDRLKELGDTVSRIQKEIQVGISLLESKAKE